MRGNWRFWQVLLYIHCHIYKSYIENSAIIQTRISYLFLTEVPVSKPVTTSCTHEVWWSVSCVNLARLQSPSSQSNTNQVFLWGDFADVIKVLNQVILSKGDYPRLSVGPHSSIERLQEQSQGFPEGEIPPVDGSFTPCPGIPACPDWWHTLGFLTCLASIQNHLRQFLAINLLMYLLPVPFLCLNFQ